jgi:hypothetical protein
MLRATHHLPAGQVIYRAGSEGLAQRRSAELVALHGGQAADRLLGLIRLLADGAGRVILPARQDIADITALRFETISRSSRRSNACRSCHRSVPPACTATAASGSVARRAADSRSWREEATIYL